MSIPYGKHYGASFREAILIYEALQNISYEEPEKEADRLSLLNYTYSKMTGIYPYQWDDYVHKTPTAKKPDAVKNEIEATE